MVGCEWQTQFNVEPGSRSLSLVLGPAGPNLDLTWDLDLSLTIMEQTGFAMSAECRIFFPELLAIIRGRNW